ncbi:MAG: phosphatase PAP2 family protein [Elusimicrobiales bacterium]|nr:phosphatase PAP2 family protein [Elusimicrobiales bacterium]
MKYRKTAFACGLLLAAALAAGPAFCADWVIPQTTYYITARQQSFPDFPAPPAAGSQQDQADLAVLKEWQLKRTPEECARANAGAHADYDKFFGDISPFAEPLPEAAAVIFKRIKQESDGAAAEIKKRFKRQRPFLRDASLEPCLGRIGGLAYPSGHATISRVLALVLADLVPEHRDDFLVRADQAALDRVVGGVHHPSDIEAGKLLADRLYKAFKKSKKFKRDMQTLKALLPEAAPGGR